MPYYNYHAHAKKLIREGHLIKYEFRDWRDIKNALVLYFDNNRPMPIRPERAGEYADLPAYKQAHGIDRVPVCRYSVICERYIDQ